MSGKTKIVGSTCALCHAGCGVLIHIKDGKPVKIEGDPKHPVNKGALCIVGTASLEHLYNPGRLTHPLQRTGERGEGKWQKITWDEALNRIAYELKQAKEKYGTETVAFLQGGAKGYSDSCLSRLANVFGSPNIGSMSYICFHSKLRGMLATYGFMSHPDYEYPPECIVLWGINPASTSFPQGNMIKEALQKGSKLLVIDPGETVFTKRADIWARPKPSSDLALALGLIHVIINEGFYDSDFVGKWTVGFNELKTHVQDYPPEKVAEMTWVPANTIRDLARFYATRRPACIVSGNGLENNLNNYQSSRAVSILRAITGNIGIPGGEVEFEMPAVLPYNALELHRYDMMPSELRSRRVGAEEGVLPNYFSALPQKLVKAMLTAKPYPIRAAFVQGGGLLHTYTNVREVYEALKSLDFLAVTDLFMTPTAELADIVLPAATYLEIDNLCPSGDIPILSISQKVAQVGQCRSDYQILSELSKRLGLGDYFWENDEKILDFILKPAGLTFNELRRIGVIYGKKSYRGYERNGFRTPSGKVEIYSKQLEEWGFDPLPVYREPLELLPINQESPADYPLILNSMKLSPYIHSRGRQIPSLRKSHNDPIVRINSDTAGKLGIKNDDWVYIENKLGRIRQKAALSPNIHPQLIIADFGWWFPERNEDLHGWAESNYNILTDNKPPYARELGSVTLRGIRCKVYKAC